MPTDTTPATAPSTPAAPAPAAAAPQTAPAAPAKVAYNPKVKDVSPQPVIIHEIPVPADQALAFAALIDPNAPAGKTIKQIMTQPVEGALILKVAYNP